MSNSENTKWTQKRDAKAKEDYKPYFHGSSYDENGGPRAGFIDGADLYLKTLTQAKIIAELKSTVKFYADGSKWQHSGHDQHHVPVAIQDEGLMARETLQHIALLELGDSEQVDKNKVEKNNREST